MCCSYDSMNSGRCNRYITTLHYIISSVSWGRVRKKRWQHMQLGKFGQGMNPTVMSLRELLMSYWLLLVHPLSLQKIGGLFGGVLVERRDYVTWKENNTGCEETPKWSPWGWPFQHQDHHPGGKNQSEDARYTWSATLRYVIDIEICIYIYINILIYI